MRCYGVCDIELDWIRVFLVNSYQSVRIGACISPFCPVISGVPQGSILGPVLFIIFVNDIARFVDDDVSVKLFADDAKMYSVITDVSVIVHSSIV
jgi:ribonuclease P/MRP protein subunit RPP40